MYGVDIDHLKKCEKVEKVEQCMEWMLIISKKMWEGREGGAVYGVDVDHLKKMWEGREGREGW